MRVLGLTAVIQPHENTVVMLVLVEQLFVYEIGDDLPVDVPLAHEVGVHTPHGPVRLRQSEGLRSLLCGLCLLIRFSILSAQQKQNRLLVRETVITLDEADGIAALALGMVEPLVAPHGDAGIVGRTELPAGAHGAFPLGAQQRHEVCISWMLRHLPYRPREILYLTVSVPQPVLAVLLDAGTVRYVVNEIFLLIQRLHVVFPHLLDECGGAALSGVIQIFLVLNEFPAGWEGLQQPCDKIPLLFCSGECTALIRQQLYAGTGGNVAGTMGQLRGILSALEVGRDQYDPGHSSSGSMRRWLRTAFSKLT